MSSVTQLSRLAWVGLCFGLASCTPAVEPPGTHPALLALASACESQELNLDFWIDEAVAGSSVWQKALSFCRAHTHQPLPNCRLVLTAYSARAALAPPTEPEPPFLLFRQPSVGEPFLAPTGAFQEKTP